MNNILVLDKTLLDYYNLLRTNKRHISLIVNKVDGEFGGSLSVHGNMKRYQEQLQAYFIQIIMFLRPLRDHGLFRVALHLSGTNWLTFSK